MKVKTRDLINLKNKLNINKGKVRKQMKNEDK